ncbi:hypothetical protein B0H17DRAFT_1072727 [Mycena rosella]|uniref:FAD-binding PCMH-type domain-containing protein n=1 Tax=Mycena rosella TaxID=1033263 RepID=A0AAD7D9D0_MYCRO|nr:hypothetical protein B0H17DRAFT_1072727 [Mycena rosella]
MQSLGIPLALIVVAVSRSSCWAREMLPATRESCRNVPGSLGYPAIAAWNEFNGTISGRLVAVVPSAKFCRTLPGGACTDAQWSSGLFRSAIPGAMDQVNFEQGYDLTPPSLCLRNAKICGQGDVPIYSVEAETVADIQAAVKFATKHDLRVAVKSSGHDTLGRSTAPGSLLIRTTSFRTLTFTDSFYIGAKDIGSAVTMGSGVHSQTLYQQAKINRRAVLGPGAAATVCVAGGFVQGAGHSPLSPKLGLAADNAFEFDIVVASGELLKVNSISHSDLFYALRGGGSGSWGVIVSATFRTFPTFNATFASIALAASNDTAANALATIHAQHIFDMDSVRASHSFILSKNAATGGSTVALVIYLPDTTTAKSMALVGPFMHAALAVPGISLLSQNYSYVDINDPLFQSDDNTGGNGVLGSRLIPAQTYHNSPAKVGQVYEQLLNSGTTNIIEVVVAGGKVAENANISSAVHPAWRTAKAHLILANGWLDSASLAEIDVLRKKFKTQQLPILELISGPNAGSYSNEADVLEAEFPTTFFGQNYAKLSAIKAKYDPADLFIVGAGVGSERWDEWGICQV